MQVQYFYPTSDNYASPTYKNQDFNLPLYPSVDEGVETYNDSDFVYGLAPPRTPSNPYESISLQFGTSPVNVIPDNGECAHLNIRCRVTVSGVTLPAYSYGYYAVDASGTLFQAYGSSAVDFTNLNYQNYSIPLNIVSHSGNVRDQFFGDFHDCNIGFYCYSRSTSFYSALQISAMEIVFSGENVYRPNNSIDLFINGPTQNTENITLFIRGVIPTGLANSIPLYTLGSALSDNGTDLFCQSSKVEDNCDLYIAGHVPANQSLDLSVSGGYINGDIPLSILNIPNSTQNNQLSLNIFATLNSGLYGFTDLYTINAGVSASVPIFIKTQESGFSNDYLPIFVKNDTTSSNFVPLMINNTIQENNNQIKLRIGGAGQNEGWNVGDSFVPLFINRNNEGIDSNITFFTNGPSGTYESLPFGISGGFLVSDGIDLVLPDSVGPINKSMSTYVHGF